MLIPNQGQEEEWDRDPSKALRDDVRYSVLVEMGGANEARPGQYAQKSQTFKLKRENLELIEASFQTDAAMIPQDVNVGSADDMESADPGIAGIFPGAGSVSCESS